MKRKHFFIIDGKLQYCIVVNGVADDKLIICNRIKSYNKSCWKCGAAKFNSVNSFREFFSFHLCKIEAASE